MINKPTFVSLGDPSGIGPEVFIKAINDIKIGKVEKIYEQKKHICCGINSIRVLLFLIKYF